jgi:hypothetical protein
MTRVLHLAALVGTWYPPAVLALLYGNWLVVCVALGRVPVPMRDDPKHLGDVTAVVHWFAVLGLAAGFYPFLVSASILAVAALAPSLPNRQEMRRRLGFAAGGGLLAYALVRWDPGRIVEWFFD